MRVDEDHSRVALTADPAMRSGVAFDVPLAALRGDDDTIEVDVVLPRLRCVTGDTLDRYARDTTTPCDSHGNRLPDPSGGGLTAASAEVAPEQELLTVFQLMQRGPLLTSVRDVFLFTGFMLGGDEMCRIYVRLVSNGVSYGLDVPLRTVRGMSASFETELTMKLDNDGELYEPVTDRSDDYCTLAYDLSSWMNSAPG
ncbi:hypothetical protein O7600_11415 [Micromonospora sp. WMMA1998]|uniref:hypothetical protein n=1 Tax=Micromonospora sp. WMMA1998 TaxID=3015167 RepID=UPI00248D2103|nr:hypothetical protein [Micromonospora sp. WMMA1998]WBC17396.1 hypothetical protein O7600_11415 [Micromonospora sp. WMMA1998]